jgi:tRNA (guanine37-N1)-methyltransferase
MIEALRASTTQIAARSDGGVVLVDGGGRWLLTAESLDGGVALLRAALADGWERPRTVVAHRPGSVEAVEDVLGLEAGHQCHQVVFLGEAVPAPPRDDLHYSWLGVEYIDFVHSTYSLGLDRDYVAERVAAGAVLGAFLDEGDEPAAEPIGYMGIHGEGSMGMLEVLPAHRRQHVGESLQLTLTSLRLAGGHIPYGQVIVGNDASLALQRKLGFTISTPDVTWMHRPK